MSTPTSPTNERSPRRPRRLALSGGVVVVATMLLVAAGCGDDDTDDTTAGEAGGGAGDDLTVSIEEPADGAELSTPFDLEIDTGVPLGEPDTGRHHVHVFYDGNTQDGEYDLVYEPTHTVDRTLESGGHTIEAVIANADHSLTDARHEITVTVGGAATGTDATDTETDSDTDGGY